MLKLIIIDDEKYIREGLVTYIDWNSLGVEVCMTFDNAKDALNSIEDIRPDIILSDIRMPKMDGIEMLKVIKSATYKCEVIFISAYRSFDYAQEAVKYGAFDYILKPVRKDDLQDTISRCVTRIMERETIGKEEGSIKLERQKDLTLYLLSGSTGEDSRAEMVRKLGVPEDSGATLAIVRFENSDIRSLSEEEALCICTSMGLFNEEHLFVTLKLVDQEVLIFAFGGSQPATACSIKDLIGKITGMNEPVIVGISSADMDNDPKVLYNKASWAALCFEVGYGSKVSSFKEFQLYANKFKKTMPKAADFISSIKSGDNYRLNQTLNIFFLSLAGDDTIYDTDMVKLEITKLFDGIFMSIDSYPIWAEIESMSSKKSFRQSISSIKSIFLIYTISRNILNNIISVINSQQFNSKNQIINSAINIIQKDLVSDISLENIAKRLFVNSNYLSRIFSNEMSMSFSQFRTKMRIARAKELLHNSKYKIYEIAAMVGYNDVPYFTKVFTSFEGVSPSEYREKNKSEM